MEHRIEKLRRESGFSQGDFAKAIGCKQAALSNWENGWSDPPISYLPKIAKALGCSIDDLFIKEAEE